MSGMRFPIDAIGSRDDSWDLTPFAKTLNKRLHPAQSRHSLPQIVGRLQ